MLKLIKVGIGSISNWYFSYTDEKSLLADICRTQQYTVFSGAIVRGLYTFKSLNFRLCELSTRADYT